MRHIILFFIIAVLFTKTGFIHGQTMYLPNPGSGLMVDYFDESLTSHNEEFYRTGNDFIYFTINKFLTDECIKNGKINEKVLYENIKNIFDKSFLFTRNRRYIVCIGCSYDGNCQFNPYVVTSSQGEKLYCWYPPKMYTMISKQKYPPLVAKAIYPQKFKETNMVSILDFRNKFVKSMYDSILRLFARYLEEPVKAPGIKSSSNASQECKKGDFVSRIEINFMGPWGEGITSYYSDYKNSDDLIYLTELYKKYFYKYWIIAPSYGMRTNTTKNKNIYRFQYYLLTTTYGSLKKDRNGLYYGHKEFGLGVSHLGGIDYKYDFDLPYKNIDFKRIAQKKCLKAPFVGENNGRIAEETALMMDNIKDYGVSLCKPWTAVNINDIPDSTLQKWREAASFFGYHFYINGNHTSVKNNTLNVYFLMGNRSYSPLYDDFWLPQIVIRDKDGKELQVINIDKDLNLKSIPCKKSPLNYEVMVNAKKQVNVAITGCKVYFRIIDKCHINENMYLDNDGRTTKGEYLLCEYQN